MSTCIDNTPNVAKCSYYQYVASYRALHGVPLEAIPARLIVAISNAQISLILPGLELLVGTNVRVSGDSARRALSNGVCNAIYD